MTCEKIRKVGLLYGDQPHHLDHIASLCIALQIPLIVTEESLKDLAEKFYPQLVVFCFDYLEVPTHIIHEYQAVVSTQPTPILKQIFEVSETLYQKKLQFLWTPHGNSDKGLLQPLMEGLEEEKIVFAYGPKMIDFFKEKGVYHRFIHTILMGNLRLQIYSKQKKFFETLFRNIFKTFEKREKTIFYAPTWEDSEESGSFKKQHAPLIDKLPHNYSLLIKPHPNTIKRFPSQIINLEKMIQKKPNIALVQDFPLIYPLIDLADVYLGDMSSIGYDFLTYNKPMFFFEHPSKRTFYLQACGKVLTSKQSIYNFLEDSQVDLKQKRAETYHYTFGTNREWEKLRKETDNALKKQIA